MTDQGPIELNERRLILMRQAAAEMAHLSGPQCTLEEFENRTARMATERKWGQAGFKRQHLRHHDGLRLVYEATRFPSRDPDSVRIRGTKKASEPELLARLIETTSLLVDEKKARREAEQHVARVTIDNAVELTREFIRQMGLAERTSP
jgi:hypothetical protein